MAADLDALRPGLKACASDLVREVLRSEPNRALSTPRTLRWGRKGSFVLDTDRAVWFDHERGEGGDALALIMRELGCSFAEAVSFAGRFVNMPATFAESFPDSFRRRNSLSWSHHAEVAALEAQQNDVPLDEAEDAAARQRAPHLWDRATHIGADDDVGRYLQARGCRLPDPAGDLRCLPPSPRYPLATLVARVSSTLDPDRGLTLHFTPCRLDGTRGERKLMAGLPKAGGVVRLDPDDAVTTGLCVAEGIETALSMPSPAWATVDAGNLAKLPVLDGIEALTIAVDADEAGRRAAEQCATRWHAAGCEVRLVDPGDAHGA